MECQVWRGGAMIPLAIPDGLPEDFLMGETPGTPLPSPRDAALDLDFDFDSGCGNGGLFMARRAA